jgi:translation initiation factor 3 subunit A
VDPNSLETIILYLMQLSESRAALARQKADKVALVAAARVSDLDQEESPESIMLSSMTEDGARDRTDREVVVPWLKFLWENYRAILELLSKIPKLDKLYHTTCSKAFKFCQEYGRVLEFRRLCDMLRQHLAFLTNKKVQLAPVRNPRPVWEWTPETLDAHLQTRFSQLEVATNLELWNEGFRTIEDIFGLMVAGKFRPRPKLMVMYYEKLTRIFWVSENKLFHAYAWFRYYSLSIESRKDLKPEERSVLASSVLLSALTIPSFKDIYLTSLVAGEAVEFDDEIVVVEKHNQIAQLLDFQNNPSRKALLADIVSRGILTEVLPELAVLYDCLEVKFQPLSLVSTLTAAVNAVRSHPQLGMYALSLQRVIVTKVMQQLSRAYSAVKLEFVFKLMSGLSDLSASAIEKIIIESAAQKQLQLKVNHAAGCIQFTSSSSSTESAFENQAALLGSSMKTITGTINSHLEKKALDMKKAAARKDYFVRVLDALDQEYSQCLDRKIQIERRKENLERLQQEREKERSRRVQFEESVRQVMFYVFLLMSCGHLWNGIHCFVVLLSYFFFFLMLIISEKRERAQGERGE